MPKRHYSKKIPERIQALLDDELVKTDLWASGQFLPSILNQYMRKGSLSDGQFSHLERLEESFLGSGRDEVLKGIAAREERLAVANADWQEEFDADYAEDAKLVLKYYDMVEKVERESYWTKLRAAMKDGKLPNRKAFLRMIGHTKCKKSLEEWKKDPLYPIKSHIQPRAPYKRQRSHPLYGVEFGFVMKINVEAARGCNGGKKYLILDGKSFRAIVCEERHIKKLKES